mgnify:CR=1 FL=1
MIEVSNKLSEADWLDFNEVYVKHLSKKRVSRAMSVLPIYLLLLLYFVYRLISELNLYMNTLYFPLNQALRLAAGRIFVVIVIGLICAYALFHVYAYYSSSYLRKKLRKQMDPATFEESRICLTDESIGTYSSSTDLRLSWEKVAKLVYTDKLIVLYGPGMVCIIIAKSCLTEEELTSVEAKIDSCYSGEVVKL